MDLDMSRKTEENLRRPTVLSRHRPGTSPFALGEQRILRMRSKLWWCIALSLTLAPPAISQEKLDPDSFARWGGTWISDCTSNKSSKVTVFEDALVFLEGDKKVEGGHFRVASGWFGNSPPENYRTALLSELPGEKQFLAFIYEDEQGEYITLDGDAEVVAQIGKPALGAKYRKCDAAKRAAADAAESKPEGKPASNAKGQPQAAAGAAPDAVALMADPQFKALYHKALGAYASEEWLATLDGPTSPSRTVKVAKKDYLLINSCKNHDCYDNNVVILYSPAKKLVYGKVVINSTHGLFGSPPPAVSQEMEGLWRAQFRSSP
jgi:hypothetical protein